MAKAKAAAPESVDQGHHPGFTVFVGLDSFYNWEALEAGDEPEEGEVVTESADGRVGVRRLRSADTYTAIQFGTGAFDLINADRKEAGLPEQTFNRQVAEHIEDAQMPHHAPREAWTWIAVPGLPETEEYLQQAFNLPGPPDDNPMFNPPADEPEPEVAPEEDEG